jgi:hypothetical protein
MLQLDLHHGAGSAAYTRYADTVVVLKGSLSHYLSVHQA